jgi:hypothetical protein
VSTLCDDIPNDVDQIVVEKSTARKMIINGALFIMLEDGTIYDVQGNRVW